MVDEFDKAPTEVVCILKGLLEDGEVLLADGNKFVSEKSPMFGYAKGKSNGIYRIHPVSRACSLRAQRFASVPA